LMIDFLLFPYRRSIQMRRVRRGVRVHGRPWLARIS
jgi:hypothetical protein